jgi:biotin operon repressor
MSKNNKQLELDLPHVRKIDIVREFVDNNDNLGKLSEMSRKLKVKEGTVSCYIVALRKQGYGIVTGPRGYTVTKRPGLCAASSPEEVRTYGSNNRGSNHRFGAVWDGYDKERVASDATTQDHNYAAVIRQYNDVKEDLKVAQQARVSMLADIDQCRQVIAGIEIDGPAALAHMEDLMKRHFELAGELDKQRGVMKKLKSRHKASSYLADSARTNGLQALRAYHWSMITLGSLISSSLMAIAIKLWS